jgi:myotubularin-related protein 6/7/8
MNGPKNVVTERYLGNGDEALSSNRTVLTGVETAHVAAGVARPSSPFRQEHSDAEPAATRQVSNGNPGAFASLRDGISGLGIGRGKGTSGGSKSPASGKQAMEVEMQ